MGERENPWKFLGLGPLPNFRVSSSLAGNLFGSPEFSVWKSFWVPRILGSLPFGSPLTQAASSDQVWTQ